MQRTSRTVVVLLAAIAVCALSTAVSGVSAEGVTNDTPLASGEASNGIVAYYFHGNVRCATCRKIEAYTEEAIDQGFADELRSGRITWRVVNVDDSENKHFIDDFQLVTKSVVLVEYRDGKVSRWQNLDKVWQLVRGKDRFIRYVQSQTREFLGES